jgi:tRNA(His) guanylyltransferase
MFREAVPSWAVQGTMVKKEQYEFEGRNKKTEQLEKTLRTRTRAVDSGLTEFPEANLSLVIEKYLT